MNYKLEKVVAQRPTKTVYCDGEHIIKHFVPNYLISNVLNEALNHAKVEEATDLNIPSLKEVTTIDNRWALVTKYIEGTTLEELLKKYPEQEAQYLEFFVDIQIEILSKKVPLLNRIKDKFKRKLTEAVNIDDNTRYELLQRLEGMKNHDKLCHGDFNLSNIVVTPDGKYYILDWSHATQGNASADAARTFLLFSMQGKELFADKYLNLFSKRSGIPLNHIQRWIPIVAATQMTKGKEDEYEFLSKWIDIVDYE